MDNVDFYKINENKGGCNMEYFEKKITYLRGLCDGSGYPPDSKEGKIFHGILDVLDDIAFMLESYMEDDDDFDEMLYDDSEEPSYLYSFICPNCGNEIEVDEQTMENEQEIVCPECSNTIPVGTADVDELKF